MFRRRNIGSRFGRREITFESNSYKEQEQWNAIDHFAYAYLYFIDFEGGWNPKDSTETPIFARAIGSWFPEECYIDSTIDSGLVVENAFAHRNDYSGNKDEVFTKSLSFIKDWFKDDSEKLEIMLDEIWELIASDNQLTNREKELFLKVSKTFDIPIDLE
tara:strand:+ start:1145 stop:1624 length:480 start_codon:yes stop_codon:yes gene_type:complete